MCEFTSSSSCLHLYAFIFGESEFKLRKASVEARVIQSKHSGLVASVHPFTSSTSACWCFWTFSF